VSAEDPMSQLPTDRRAAQSRGGSDLSHARSILLTMLSVEVAVLVVTGIALFFLYRPTAGQAWNDVVTASEPWDVRLAHGLRLAHRLASWLTVPTAIAVAVVVAVGGWETVRRWRGVALSAGLALTALTASWTGFLLPWDQLALWAVEVGTNLRGYRPLFGPEVKFVLLGGVELSPETVIQWLLVHSLVLGPALAGLVLLAWRRTGPTPPR
jgi:quinol---cytochrome c reductase cytochrome b subunit, bacillus type